MAALHWQTTYEESSRRRWWAGEAWVMHWNEGHHANLVGIIPIMNKMRSTISFLEHHCTTAKLTSEKMPSNSHKYSTAQTIAQSLCACKFSTALYRRLDHKHIAFLSRPTETWAANCMQIAKLWKWCQHETEMFSWTSAFAACLWQHFFLIVFCVAVWRRIPNEPFSMRWSSVFFPKLSSQFSGACLSNLARAPLHWWPKSLKCLCCRLTSAQLAATSELIEDTC